MKKIFCLILVLFCFVAKSHAIDNVHFKASATDTLKSEEFEAYKQLKLPEAMLIVKNKEKEPFAYGLLKIAVSIVLLGSLEDDEFLSSTKLVHCLDNMETDTLLKNIIDEGKAHELSNIPLLRYVSSVAWNKCEYLSQDKYLSILEQIKSSGE